MPDGHPAPDHLVRVVDHKDISWIVLNRPDRMNAMSQGLLDQFDDALRHLRTHGAPVIGIRGEGRGFSAGLDLDEIAGSATNDPMADRERLSRNLERFLRVWDHPKPVIAAVHGFCVAAATLMCALADITIVEHDARISEPALPLGGGYLEPVWTTLVGIKHAKELSFVPGASIDGRTAAAWGWANRSVEESDLIPVVEELAAAIARTPPELLTIKKMAANRTLESSGFRLSLQAAIDLDALAHQTLAVTMMRALVDEVGPAAAVARFRG